MIRNIILAAFIGALASYLPFWQWGDIGTQVVGILGLGVISFIVLVATERKEYEKI